MLLTMLDKLSENIINKHPNVDFGGCCVVAAAVAKHLINNNVPTRIVVGNSFHGSYDLDCIRANDIKNPLDKYEWECNGVDFAHVLVEFEVDGDVYAFDSSNGVLPRDTMWRRLVWRRCEGAFTLEEATALADTDDWNELFDRSEIPAIRRKITMAFNKLTKG